MFFSQHRIVLAASTLLLAISRTQAAVTSEGCYVDDGSLTSQGTYAYQSEGYCSTLCSASNYAVFAMSDGNTCSCGNSLPAGSSVSSSSCNLACSGYPSDICGGDGFYSVWLTGVGTLSGSSGSGTASAAAGTTLTSTRKSTTTSSTSSTTQAPSVIYVTTAVVQQGVTVIQTVSASTRSAAAAASSGSSSRSSLSSTSSKSGISGGAIAGIVIGVLALAAIAGVAAFFLLRRRRRNAEEFSGEYKRQIEPAGAGYISTQPPSPDNRLDTSLAIRRNSSESLADNQDYSRKILRVVN